MQSAEVTVADQTKRQISAVGERLRALRTTQGFSLSKVASECDLSPSLLSQVERGLVAPSLHTLYALAHFYGVNLFELFDDESQAKHIQVTRAADRRIIRFGHSQNEYELITPAHLTTMSVFELVVKSDEEHHPGVDQPLGGITHGGEENILVLSGRIRVMLGETSYTLETGDAIYYDGTIPHSFSNDWTEHSRILVMTNPAV